MLKVQVNYEKNDRQRKKGAFDRSSYGMDISVSYNCYVSWIRNIYNCSIRADGKNMAVRKTKAGLALEVVQRRLEGRSQRKPVAGKGEKRGTPCCPVKGFLVKHPRQPKNDD